MIIKDIQTKHQRDWTYDENHILKNNSKIVNIKKVRLFIVKVLCEVVEKF